MTGFTVALVLVVATAGLLRWRHPAWHWLAFGVTLAALRVLVRYGTVMDACGLTVPPSRWRLALARATNRPMPEARPPRILRLRPTPAWSCGSNSGLVRTRSTSPPPRTGSVIRSRCTA